LFAAKDARTGKPERRADAERILETFRMLRRETQATNNDPAMAVLEAQLARVDGDLEHAAWLFSRAVREARTRDLTPIVAYASEERANMLREAGDDDEATLFYREAVIAYRRWAHMTKVLELEQAHPPCGRASWRAATMRGGRCARGGGSDGGGHGRRHHDGADGERPARPGDGAQGIAGHQHAAARLGGGARGADRDREERGRGAGVFVLRAANGVETVYGEVHGGAYRDINVPLDQFAALPKSVVRVVRRTGRPLVVADAMSDPGHAGDPFVVETRGRSIAGIPIRRKGEVTGFVVLENRMVAGAFSPQLVSLTHALWRSAISLDNASLYRTWRTG